MVVVNGKGREGGEKGREGNENSNKREKVRKGKMTNERTWKGK